MADIEAGPLPATTKAAGRSGAVAAFAVGAAVPWVAWGLTVAALLGVFILAFEADSLIIPFFLVFGIGGPVGLWAVAASTLRRMGVTHPRVVAAVAVAAGVAVAVLTFSGSAGSLYDGWAWRCLAMSVSGGLACGLTHSVGNRASSFAALAAGMVPLAAGFLASLGLSAL